MIVDDSVDIREALCTALEDAGMACLTASNGAEALRRLWAGPIPDLILLDLMMPIMDGVEFLEEQKKDPRLAAIPVLILSAFQKSPLDKTHSYLHKPIDLERLLAAIREKLARSP
jgi:CheY-like chemotaxis protein